MNIDYIEKYKCARNRLILLDYDGTLVDFEPIPEMAIPSVVSLNTLRIIGSHMHTKLYVITGRSQSVIDSYFGDLTINIIAEHGAVIKEKGTWKNQIIDYGNWRNPVLSIFSRYVVNCPESFIEEKKYSVTWHYRRSQPKLGHELATELIGELRSVAQFYQLRIIDGNMIVEVMRNDINKGKAVNNILNKSDFDYILAIGDDKTDEDMFLELLENTNAYTIKVGSGKTFAKERIANVADVMLFLKKLALTN